MVRPVSNRFVGVIGVLIAAGACGLCGCSAAPKQVEAPGAKEPEPRAPRQTSLGGYYVTYETSPAVIPVNKIFSIDVRVCTDAAMQQPAAGVQIGADAAMPSHHHGMNLTPKVEKVGEGRFKVTGMLFHMPGPWELYIDVRGSGETERARFEVEL
jgi:hypothetical protein